MAPGITFQSAHLYCIYLGFTCNVGTGACCDLSPRSVAMMYWLYQCRLNSEFKSTSCTQRTWETERGNDKKTDSVSWHIRTYKVVCGGENKGSRSANVIGI